MNQRKYLTICAVVTLGALTSALPQAARSVASPALPTPNAPQTDAQRKAYAPGDTSAAAVVNAFNQMAFFDHDPVNAMKKYLAADFIERSPDFGMDDSRTDKEAVVHFFETRGWKKGDPSQDTVYQVIADTDHAAVFHKVVRTPGDRGTAYVDIFRVKNGLIVEHWAVAQPVSDKVSARHSMF